MNKLIGPAFFYKKALLIALPVMAQALIQSMVSLIDNFMVAALGDTAMAAVNVANQVNFVYIVLMNTICQAGGIYMAQFNGASDADGMKNAFRFKALFLALAALAYFALCQAMPASLIGVMTAGNAAREEIIAEGAAYIRLCSWTAFPAALSFAIGTSYREVGRPSVPMVISAAATVVNTAGNWVLIYGNLGAPALGVQGAAIATIIARCVEAAVFTVYARGKKPAFFAPARTLFRVDPRLTREIFRKSAMIFVSEVSWVSSETIMTALYNGRGGAEVVAGMAAGFTLANIYFLVFGGVWTASQVIVGGELGAGKLENAARIGLWLRSGAVLLAVIVAVLGLGLQALVIPAAFARLSAEARTICFHLTLVVLAYLPLWALLNAYFAITRAGGDTLTGLAADLTVNTFLFVPLVFFLALFTRVSPVALLALAKLTDAAKLAICIHFFAKDRWIRNLTKTE